MDFESCLAGQLKLHAGVQPQDVVKMCYQAAFGAEHLLGDVAGAEKYFQEEYAAVEGRDEPLYESISEDFCRVNLSAWKGEMLPSAWLFRMFAASAGAPHGSPELFRQYLKKAGEMLQGRGSDDYIAYSNYLEEYGKSGMSAVRHSPRYREANAPAYRIVDSRFMGLLPVLREAGKHDEKCVCVIAIDGRAASGKTTMAGLLSVVLDGAVVHMDDFFLPEDLRTPGRFQTPGGNVHYERFAREVLPNLSLPEDFSYRRFDCGEMDLCEPQKVPAKPFRIVEGAYSHHPALGQYADVKVFSDVEGAEQMRRILRRNGTDMAERFRNLWIPMEEAYFRAYGIMEKADIRLAD